MLQSLHLTNVTLFQQAELSFSPGLNVFVGENGCGKSHLLKLAYVMAACLQDPLPTRSNMQSLLADKLVAVLRPEALGRLVRRPAGRERAELEARWSISDEPLRFRFSTNSRSEVVVDAMPDRPLIKRPCFLPTRELLTIAPGFVALYENRMLEFDETWRDTCLLLQAPRCVAQGNNRSRFCWHRWRRQWAARLRRIRMGDSSCVRPVADWRCLC